MINAVQAFLQRESVFVVHIFYQPTYLARQKQMQVALLYLKHASFFFLMSINSSISSISHWRPCV